MIYLNIPSFPDPQSASPINAFAKINGIEANFLTGNAKVILGVYRSVDALTNNSVPFDNIIITAGGYCSHGNVRSGRPPMNNPPLGVQTGTTFPTLMQFATDESVQWDALWAYIMSKAILISVLSGATIVNA